MLYIHRHKKRNVNTIVDGEGADSNNGKLSFPAHEGVLRGKLFCARLDRWSVNHREVNAQRNIHSHKSRLCPSLFLQAVRLLCYTHRLTLYTAIKNETSLLIS